MAIVQKRVDIFGQVEALLQGRSEFITPKAVIAELSAIGQEKSKRGRCARMGLKLAEKCKTLEKKRLSEESTDDNLVRLAKEISGMIATSDMELRNKARNANIPVIYLKGDLRLAVEGIDPAYG
jgi:rRNA-processing protein FCF1